MKCPHCLKEFHAEWTSVAVGNARLGGVIMEGRTSWMVHDTLCPACAKVTIVLEELELIVDRQVSRSTRMIRPKVIARTPIPSEVPKEFVEDYEEACAVLPDSAKASAALSRRCLQHLLRERGGYAQRDLYDQIQAALDSQSLPSDIAHDLDSVRVVGNFAAHPLKSTNSDTVLPVEPGEAEWNLEVIEGLFDFYFVRPAASAKRRDALNKKLTEAGKPPLRT